MAAGYGVVMPAGFERRCDLSRGLLKVLK